MLEQLSSFCIYCLQAIFLVSSHGKYINGTDAFINIPFEPTQLAQVLVYYKDIYSAKHTIHSSHIYIKAFVVARNDLDLLSIIFSTQRQLRVYI